MESSNDKSYTNKINSNNSNPYKETVERSNSNNRNRNDTDTDNKTTTTTMKDPCGVCAPFLVEHDDSEEVVVTTSPKNMISDIHDIVKVESIVASPSKLDCIVEEKKEEDGSATSFNESRDAPTLNDVEETTNTELVTVTSAQPEKDMTMTEETDGLAEVPPEIPESVTEQAVATTEVVSSSDIAKEEPAAELEEEEEPTLECDFDKNPTDLYLCLMRKDWSGSIRRCVQRPEEAKTWIYRKEPTGTIRWKLLPIHAAIIFNAPVPVVDALLHAHLFGADCKDDQGMVPLHLAIRMNSDHTIVEKLVMARPNSVQAKDRKGRTPRVLADKQEACPQKLLVIQTLENVNSTTTTETSTPAPATAPKTTTTKRQQKSVTIDTTGSTKAEAAPSPTKTPVVSKSITPVVSSPLPPAVEKVFSAEEVEGVKHTYEIQMEKVSRESLTMQNTLKQQIEILENNAKRDAETIRTLEESVRTAQDNEAEHQSKIVELETLVQSTITEKNNLEDSNKAVIVNLVSQIGVLQSKFNDMTNERDTIASQMADLDESSKQEIAQRKLRCLELERQLGQVTYMKEECEENLHKAEETITAQKGQITLLKDDLTKLQNKLTITETKLEEVTVSEQELAWQNHALSVTGQMYAKNNGTEMSSQIKVLEKEREELRETVNKLSVKLYKVVGFLDEMVQEQEAIITETLTRDGEINSAQLPPQATSDTMVQQQQPLPMSEDRLKLLSNVSGMKEQIIGVIDSVIDSMPQQDDEIDDNITDNMVNEEVTEDAAVVEVVAEETPIISTKPLPLP